MAYFVSHVVLFLVPGWLLCRLSGIERSRFLISVSLSYTLAVLVLGAGRISGSSVSALIVVYTLVVVVLAILAWRASATPGGPASGSRLRFAGPGFAGWLLVAIATTAYLTLVGAYLEVPADVLRHLEYSQRAWRDVADGSFRDIPSAALVSRGGRFWYYVYALLAHFRGLEITQTLFQAILANTLLLLTGVYCFSLYLFRDTFAGRWVPAVAAVLACLFFFLHQGINIFAYARYYTLAPTFLATLLYLAATALAMDGLSRPSFPARQLVLAAVITLTAALVHIQEAVFILVTGAGLLGYRLVVARLPAARAAHNTPGETGGAGRGKRILSHGRLATIALIGLVVVYLMARRGVALNVPKPDHKLLPLAALAPFLDGWYVLNPSYQFYRVVTLWGILVYALCLLRWREFVRQPFLLVGMASPLVTVFNPLFVDFFLRFSNYTTLWRMSFMIPLAFSAAWLAVRTWQDLRVGKRVFGNSIAMVALVVLLAPLPAGPLAPGYSRWYTLAPIRVDNTAAHWEDLLDYLRQVKGRKLVLTDPLTGYLVSALTQHRSPRYKFFGIGHKALNYESYIDNPLARYPGALLVVNRRDGGVSDNGRRSRHWPENVLQLSDYYSDRLLAHLSSHPERFVRVWNAERIDVYRIRK